MGFRNAPQCVVKFLEGGLVHNPQCRAVGLPPLDTFHLMSFNSEHKLDMDAPFLLGGLKGKPKGIPPFWRGPLNKMTHPYV